MSDQGRTADPSLDHQIILHTDDDVFTLSLSYHDHACCHRCNESYDLKNNKSDLDGITRQSRFTIRSHVLKSGTDRGLLIVDRLRVSMHVHLTLIALFPLFLTA